MLRNNILMLQTRLVHGCYRERRSMATDNPERVTPFRLTGTRRTFRSHPRSEKRITRARLVNYNHIGLLPGMPMLRKRSSAAPWNSIRYADDVLKSCKRTDKASSTVRLIWYFRGCFRVVDNRPGPHLLRGLATQLEDLQPIAASHRLPSLP